MVYRAKERPELMVQFGVPEYTVAGRLRARWLNAVLILAWIDLASNGLESPGGHPRILPHALPDMRFVARLGYESFGSI